MMANVVDPFDVFGDDDEDDDNHEERNESGRVATVDDNITSEWDARQVLIAAANERMAHSQVLAVDEYEDNNAKPNDESDTPHKAAESREDYILSEMQPLHMSFWKPPLYLGPVQLVKSLSFGGGRGYVAAETLEPGTLVMVETPLIGWPTEQLGKPLDLVSIQHILESPKAEMITQVMEDLHPTKSCVDGNDDQADSVQVGDMMKEIKLKYRESSRIAQLIELCEHRNIHNRDGSSISEQDVLRLLLALCYNGLESGVYCHTSMLNHDCFPNCVKFYPDASSSLSSYSEVRTTRRIRAGESLTISYVSRTLCHASRRRHLWEQHRFDIGVDYLKGIHRQMELVANKLPPSRLDRTVVDESIATLRIENTTEQLETLYHESRQALENRNRIKTATTLKGDTDGNNDDGMEEPIKALELSCLELCREAQIQLQNDRHILLVPCYRLHLDTCELVQRLSSLTTTQRHSVLGRQVVTAQRLVELQTDYYNSHDHFDLARTYLDLANAIDELLAHNPRILYQLDEEYKYEQRLSQRTTFAAWSSLEHASRKEYNRIRALYPHDADERIKDQVDEACPSINVIKSSETKMSSDP